jgi:hypothetical protein
VVVAALPLPLPVLLALPVVVVVAFVVLVPDEVFVSVVLVPDEVFVSVVFVVVVPVVVFVVDFSLRPELVGTTKTLLIVTPLGTCVPNVGCGTSVRIFWYLVYKLCRAPDFVTTPRSWCGIDVEECASTELRTDETKEGDRQKPLLMQTSGGVQQEKEHFCSAGQEPVVAVLAMGRRKRGRRERRWKFMTAKDGGKEGRWWKERRIFV